MCLCVSLLKGLPQKDAKLRNIAAIRHIYAGNSVIACFVICFVIFRKTTKPQVERFVIFSYFDRQITKRHQNYETSTLQTCHRSQKGAPLACHRAAASRPCHLATTPAACPQRGRSMPKTCAYNVCLCLSPKRFGSKYRKITKHRRNMTCLCRSQRYRVFRSFVLFVCGNHETAGRAFRNFFLIGKLRNEVKTTKRTHNTCVACHTTARHGRVAAWQYPGRVT